MEQLRPDQRFTAARESTGLLPPLSPRGLPKVFLWPPNQTHKEMVLGAEVQLEKSVLPPEGWGAGERMAGLGVRTINKFREIT